MRLALVVRDDTQFLLLKDLTLVERNPDVHIYTSIHPSIQSIYPAQRIRNIFNSILSGPTGHFRGDFSVGFD